MLGNLHCDIATAVVFDELVFGYFLVSHQPLLSLLLLVVGIYQLQNVSLPGEAVIMIIFRLPVDSINCRMMNSDEISSSLIRT